MENFIIIENWYQVIVFIITCLIATYLIFELFETIDSKHSYNAMISGYKKLNDEYIKNCQVIWKKQYL